MTLERLNPTELFVGPSLQSCVVQKKKDCSNPQDLILNSSPDPEGFQMH